MFLSFFCLLISTVADEKSAVYVFVDGVCVCVDLFSFLVAFKTFLSP